jgi:hypothetical protein
VLLNRTGVARSLRWALSVFADRVVKVVSHGKTSLPTVKLTQTGRRLTNTCVCSAAILKNKYRCVSALLSSGERSTRDRFPRHDPTAAVTTSADAHGLLRPLPRVEHRQVTATATGATQARFTAVVATLLFVERGHCRLLR